MAQQDLSIVIRASDQASKELDAVSRRLGGLGDSATGAARTAEPMMARLERGFIGIAAAGAAAGAGVFGMTNIINDSIGAASRAQSAMLGLESVSKAFGTSADAATAAARSLASDGLMTVGDAATGLKNLLATGFSLDQAVTLMGRFKDSAAFGRQSALSFGDAVRSATEGIKNGNSILVDNAGVTKNLSVILEEMGMSQQDVMRASSDVNVRMALFNGILKETNPQVGNAATLAGTFAGQQAMAAAQTEVLRQQLGTAMQQALLPFLQAITPIIVHVSEWIANNQRLAAGIAIAIAILLSLIAVVAAVGAAFLLIAPVVAVVGGAIAAGMAAAAVAVAVAVAAIIMNWDRVRGFFTSTVPQIVGTVQAWFNRLPGIAQGALGAMAEAAFGQLNRMTGGALGIIAGLLAMVSGRLGALPGIVGAASGGVFGALVAPFQNAYSTINGIVGGISGAVSRIQGAAARAGNSVRNIRVPGFANGTNYAPGGMAMVGERGPELVNLPRGSQVFTNQQTQGMLGGTQVTITGNIMLGDASAVETFFRQLDRGGQLVGKGLTG